MVECPYDQEDHRKDDKSADPDHPKCGHAHFAFKNCRQTFKVEQEHCEDICQYQEYLTLGVKALG